jgi:hypothetical protein
MDVDAFLTGNDDQIDAILGTKSMVADGQTFNVVWNDEAKSLEGEFGGLEGDIQAVAVAQTADVTSPKALLQKRCTVGGVSFRIQQVRTGTVATSFALADVNSAQ